MNTQEHPQTVGPAPTVGQIGRRGGAAVISIALLLGVTNPVLAARSKVIFRGVGNEEFSADVDFFSACLSPHLRAGDIELTLNDQSGSEILALVYQDAALCEPGDIYIFFYTGHGLFQPDDDLFEDPNGNDETIGLGGTGLTDDQLAEAFLTFDEDCAILVINDACYSGGFIGGSEDLDRAEIDAKNHLSFVAPVEKDCLAPGHSELLGSLCDALDAAADGNTEADANGDRITTLLEWVQFVAANAPGSFVSWLDWSEELGQRALQGPRTPRILWGFDELASFADVSSEVVADIFKPCRCAAYGAWGTCPAAVPAPPDVTCPPPDGTAFECKVGAVATPGPLALLGAGEFGTSAIVSKTDPIPGNVPSFETDAAGGAVISIKGVGTSVLEVVWILAARHRKIDAEDNGYFARGCADVDAILDAFLNIPASINRLAVRYEWTVFGKVEDCHECHLPGDWRWGIEPLNQVGPNGFCFADEEDPGDVGAVLVLDVGGEGPGEVFNDSVNNLGIMLAGQGDPLDSNYVIRYGRGTVFADAGQPFTFSAELVGSANMEINLPAVATQIVGGAVRYEDRGGVKPLPPRPPSFATKDNLAIIWGRIKLRVTPVVFDASLEKRFSSVDHNVDGGAYAFRIGRYETTNAQYVAFLNDAQCDLGDTVRGSFMSFGNDGTVTTPGGAVLFLPSNAAGALSRVVYDPLFPVGQRYTVQPGFEEHPVVFVSYPGAIKFLNWLTVDQAIDPAHRCYTEGDYAGDWHPATISTVDWWGTADTATNPTPVAGARDLNDDERLELVRNREGFRLPMDNLGGATGWISDQPNDFNEWYRVAAADPAAPGATRTGPGGEDVPPLHWVYGFGRDTVTPADANYQSSGDPLDDSTLPVGFFDGVNLLGDGVTPTNDTSNRLAAYDLAGNIAEWSQDYAGAAGAHAIRGGSWQDASDNVAATYRESAGGPGPAIGFRCARRMNTLPKLVGTVSNTFNLEGDSTGLGWSWCINGPGVNVCDFDVPGLLGGSNDPLGGLDGATARDLAVHFVNSINRAGAADVTAKFLAGSAFEVTVDGATAFELCVGPQGAPTTCCVPTNASCTFNPVLGHVVPSGSDCDDNEIDDAADIAGGNLVDENGNGIPDVCETGACWDPDSGSCTNETGLDCVATAGSSCGPGTSCDDNNQDGIPDACQEPFEACCDYFFGVLVDCIDTTPGDCDGRGGHTQGPNTDCATTTCPEQRACCWTELPDACAYYFPEECPGIALDAGTRCEARCEGGSQDGESCDTFTDCPSGFCRDVEGPCSLPDGRCMEIQEPCCTALGGTLVAACPTPGFRVFFVPAGHDPTPYLSGPTTLTASPGDTVFLEMFVEYSPILVRGAGETFPCTASGGSAGSVAYLMGSGDINQFRGDFLHFPQPSITGVDSSTCPDGDVRFVASVNGVGSETTAPKYVGEFALIVSPDAVGTFTFDFDPAGTEMLDVNSAEIPGLTRERLIVNVDCGTNADCDDGILCAFDYCHPTGCTNDPAGYADVAGPGGACGPSGQVNLADILAVLNGFQGIFAPPCDLHSIDIAGAGGTCEPDGEISLPDILAVLDAFQGIDPCCSGPDGACCSGSVCTDDVPRAQCTASGGVYQGTGTDCGSIQCTVGACCIGDLCTEGMAEAVCIAAGGDYLGDGSACESAVVYSNAIDPITAYFPPGIGNLVADDLELADADGCELQEYELVAYGGPNPGGTFDVHVELWDGNPCDPGSDPIAGTAADFIDVPDDGGFYLLTANLSTSVSIPGTVWMHAVFSTDEAGWIVGDQAEIGSTVDMFAYDDPTQGCDLFSFTDPGPWAGFWATILCQGCGSNSVAAAIGDIDLPSIPSNRETDQAVDVGATSPVRTQMRKLPGDFRSRRSDVPTVPAVTVVQASTAPPKRRTADSRSHAMRASAASLTLAPSLSTVLPGETIDVDVYVDGALDLRGYEISVEATGGRHGTLELIDVSIDTTRVDYLLEGMEHVTAIDWTTGRLAAVAYTGGVTISDDAYVGTFTFRTSSDAAGLFRFDVRSANTTVLDSTGGRMALESSSASISVGPPTDGRVGSKPIGRRRH